MSRTGIKKVQQNNVFRTVLGAGSSLLCISYYCKHTFLLKFYQSYIELHGLKGPVKPSEQLKNVVKEVEEDLKSLASENTSINPFIIPGLKTCHAGMIGTLQGGIIGLPAFFECNNKEDINSKITLTCTSNDEKNDEEKINCVILSDKAKKYAIAREILHVNTAQAYIETLIPFGAAYMVDAIVTNLTSNLHVYKSPLFMRSFTYAFALGFGLVVWRFLHIQIQKFFDGQVENDLTQLGRDYLEGGVEFYNKTLQQKHLQVDLKDQEERLLYKISRFINSFTSGKETNLYEKIVFLNTVLSDEVKFKM